MKTCAGCVMPHVFLCLLEAAVCRPYQHVADKLGWALLHKQKRPTEDSLMDLV